MDGSARAWRRPAVAALIVAALLIVVALASRRRSWSGGSSGTRHLPPRFWDVTITVAFILWLLFAAWAFWTLITDDRKADTPGKRNPKRVALSVFATMLLFVLIALGRLLHPGSHGRSGTPGTLQGEPPGTPRPRRLPGGSSLEPHFNRPAALITVVLLVLLAGAFVLLRRRRVARVADRRQAAAEALAQVLDETLDDLRREPDPRRAVIAAYARMERTLAAYGLGRHRSEAPAEYLRRVLAELDVGGESARRLTDLFERAKFSTHEIDGRMKTEAIDALVALRAELVAA